MAYSQLMLDYLEEQETRRRALEQRLWRALAELDCEEAIRVFIECPALAQTRAPGGGSLAHRVIQSPACMANPGAAEDMLLLLNSWGVDFTRTDDAGRRAAFYAGPAELRALLESNL